MADEPKPIRPSDAALRPFPSIAQHEAPIVLYLDMLDLMIQAMVDGGEINTGFTGKLTVDCRRGKSKHIHVERSIV